VQDGEPEDEFAVRLDISGRTDPMVVRSADNGDLTTLAMPADPAVVDENGSPR
jgi:hypothetical protein